MSNVCRTSPSSKLRSRASDHRRGYLAELMEYARRTAVRRGPPLGLDRTWLWRQLLNHDLTKTARSTKAMPSDKRRT